ncbi:MAG: hypothetical protein U1F77_09370 [Kiritimatiellia bacterium]
MNLLETAHNSLISQIDNLGLDGGKKITCNVSLFLGHAGGHVTSALTLWWTDLGLGDQCSRASGLSCNGDGKNIDPINGSGQDKGIPGIIPSGGLIGVWNPDQAGKETPNNGGYNPPGTVMPATPFPDSDYLREFGIPAEWQNFRNKTALGFFRYLQANYLIALEYANSLADDCKCGCSKIIFQTSCGSDVNNGQLDTIRTLAKRVPGNSILPPSVYTKTKLGNLINPVPSEFSCGRMVEFKCKKNKGNDGGTSPGADRY